ncbi:MAG: oligosaccharide flippase family protein [Hyphomicrobium sp.]|uniref:oligosaccharide flippase family protein n=1 Tax=Hyphomicrobium sp. TaxID=82 RepID=UPI0039E3F4B5
MKSLQSSTISAVNQPGTSLKRRVFNASAWSLAGYGASMAIRLGSNLIMTRLLVPEMFGVMAIANIIMIGLAMFSDLGLGQNIVQSRRGSEPEFLNTAWSLQIIRGMLLWLVSVCIAVAIFFADHIGMIPATSVYSNPILPYVISILSFGTVIGGFGTTKVYEANRNLALARVTKINLLAQVIGLVCMLAWAYFDRSIWALVSGAIAASAATVLLGHSLLPGTANRWHWDSSAVSDISHFGKWIFASSILGFLVTNTDRLMLGSMVDGTMLGIYSIAYLMASAVDQTVGRIVGAVTLPALSEIARGGGDLRAAYYRFHAVVSAASYFSAGALLTSGSTLVGLLYDHRYADAGWMLQILSLTLLTTPFGIASQSYLAIGKPKLLFRILVVRFLVMVPSIYLGFHFWALPGALCGVVISQISVLPLILFLNAKFKLLDLRKELLALLMLFPGAIAGWIMTLVVGHYAMAVHS